MHVSIHYYYVIIRWFIKINMIALILQLSSIKSLQKTRVQQDDVIKSQTSNDENIMLLSCIHLRNVRVSSSLHTDLMFLSPRWSGSFSGRLSHILHVRHDLFAECVPIVLWCIWLLSIHQHFLLSHFSSSFLCFHSGFFNVHIESAHKNMWVEMHLCVAHHPRTCACV